MTQSVEVNFVGLCVLNVLQTDTLTVEQLIQTYNVSVEIVSIVSVEVTVIVETVVDVVCPGRPVCSSNGVCADGLCDCAPGDQFLIHRYALRF